ncbi:MAG TPA: cobalamin-independent methionine synthase II family protein [Acidimicrobiales bacterium]|nr:cobalamin-independent methionine synthase II family protein [Acidimicrobiales bacterium]
MSALFPVTTVGSWPRSPELIAALRARQEGKTTAAEFDVVADRAVLECLSYQENAGVDIVTDGEQRRDNFYSFVVDKLEGMKLMPVSELLDYVPDRAGFEEQLRALDVPAFAIKSPVAVGKLQLRGDGLATDEATFTLKNTDHPVKVTLPGPYLLTRSAWYEGLSGDIYPTQEALAADVVSLLRREIRSLAELGVSFVQLDEPTLTQVVYGEESAETFMCAALASRRDPQEEMDFALGLINGTVEGLMGTKLGVHVCRGNWSRREDVLLVGNYGPLLPHMVQMKVDQLVLEMATPRAGEAEVFKEYSNEKEIGLGVVNPRTDEIEPIERIVDRVKEFLEFFDADKVYLNPDCGFGTFAERSVNSAGTAFRKLESIGEAAEVLRREYS